MKTKKKWGWTKKNKFRYFRKMYLNNYSTLYEIYEQNYVWNELRIIVFGDSGHKSRIPSDCKVIQSRIFRMKSKQELRNIIKNNDIENDAFPILAKNLWNYY